MAFRDIKGELYPMVGLKKYGEHVRVNFGQTPFMFDIDAMMRVCRDFMFLCFSPDREHTSAIFVDDLTLTVKSQGEKRKIHDEIWKTRFVCPAL